MAEDKVKTRVKKETTAKTKPVKSAEKNKIPAKKNSKAAPSKEKKEIKKSTSTPKESALKEKKVPARSFTNKKASANSKKTTATRQPSSLLDELLEVNRALQKEAQVASKYVTEKMAQLIHLGYQYLNDLHVTSPEWWKEAKEEVETQYRAWDKAASKALQKAKSELKTEIENKRTALMKLFEEEKPSVKKTSSKSKHYQLYVENQTKAFAADILLGTSQEKIKRINRLLQAHFDEMHDIHSQNSLTNTEDITRDLLHSLQYKVEQLEKIPAISQENRAFLYHFQKEVLSAILSPEKSNTVKKKGIKECIRAQLKKFQRTMNDLLGRPSSHEEFALPKEVLLELQKIKAQLTSQGKKPPSRKK